MPTDMNNPRPKPWTSIMSPQYLKDRDNEKRRLTLFAHMFMWIFWLMIGILIGLWLS